MDAPFGMDFALSNALWDSSGVPNLAAFDKLMILLRQLDRIDIE
jgi:hypothetical protein